MSGRGSPSRRPAIADTVVVNYFLAVGEFELLRQLLGGSVGVPRAVYDPDEADDVPEAAASELRRGWLLHKRRAGERRLATELQRRSMAALPHFESLPRLVAEGKLVAVDLGDDELETYARLRDRSYVEQFSLVAGLGRGEAAALALALGRGYDLATDDQDAIKVITALRTDLKVLRIRGLLQFAVDRGLTDIDRARAIHLAIVRAGFWDQGKI